MINYKKRPVPASRKSAITYFLVRTTNDLLLLESAKRANGSFQDATIDSETSNHLTSDSSIVLVVGSKIFHGSIN
ncbi:hypothetical protein DPMN_031994 [Dreissena polymorpha]|uniref:Uncharacterized protein n=1 Tax=Dreissena polymorpha TaxID=45954 RepID=A0A9D4M2X4_DREPO|nr:hypothetical protein DPMN_031994 [Dreissena polymorpha]